MSTRLHFKGGPWTNTDDQILLAALSSGTRDWERIASNLKKTAAQCRERWENYLDPRLHLREEWSVEEDALLVELHQLFPFQWKLISSQLTKKLPPHYIRPPWLCEKRYAQLRDLFEFEKKKEKEEEEAQLASVGGGDAYTTGGGRPAQKQQKTLEQFMQERERVWQAQQSHEEKPARVDSVSGDMHTNREEMLNIVKGRLANQDRKKGLRKERARLLEEASFLAKLQNQREATESGTLSSRQQKRMRKALDEDDALTESDADGTPKKSKKRRRNPLEEENESPSASTTESSAEDDGDGEDARTGKRRHSAFSAMNVGKLEANAGTLSKPRTLLKTMSNVPASMAGPELGGETGAGSKASLRKVKHPRADEREVMKRLQLTADPDGVLRLDASSSSSASSSLPPTGRIEDEKTMTERKKRKKKTEEEEETRVPPPLSLSSSSPPTGVSTAPLGGMRWDELVLASVAPPSTSTTTLTMLPSTSFSPSSRSSGGGGGADRDRRRGLPHSGEGVGSGAMDLDALFDHLSTIPAAPTLSSSSTLREAPKEEEEKKTTPPSSSSSASLAVGSGTIAAVSSPRPADDRDHSVHSPPSHTDGVVEWGNEERGALGPLEMETSFSSARFSPLPCTPPSGEWEGGEEGNGRGIHTQRTKKKKEEEKNVGAGRRHAAAASSASSSISFSTSSSSFSSVSYRSASLSRPAEEWSGLRSVSTTPLPSAAVGSPSRMRQRGAEAEAEQWVWHDLARHSLHATAPMSGANVGVDNDKKEEEDGISSSALAWAAQCIEDEAECGPSSASASFGSSSSVIPPRLDSAAEFVQDARPLLQKMIQDARANRTERRFGDLSTNRSRDDGGDTVLSSSSSSFSSAEAARMQQELTKWLRLLHTCFTNDALLHRWQRMYASLHAWEAHYSLTDTPEEETNEKEKEEEEETPVASLHSRDASFSPLPPSPEKKRTAAPHTHPHHHHAQQVAQQYAFLCDMYTEIRTYWENELDEKKRYLHLLSTVMAEERAYMVETLKKAEQNRLQCVVEERKWQEIYATKRARPSDA